MLLAVLLLVVSALPGGIASAGGIAPTAVNRPPVALDDPATFDNESPVIPDDAMANDQFGHTVAVDGDTAVIGMTYAADDAGAAYVYERVNGEWIETAKLVSSDPGPYEFFGWSVDIEGDTIVVGEFRDKDGAIGKGAAHVFTRDGTTWSHAAKLTPTSRVEDGEFGCAVAISGDTIAVGSYGYSGYAGGAYVFRGAGDVWAQEALIGPASSGSFYFGSALDVDGDTLVIGSYYDDAAGYDSGAAYVYTRSGTTWSYAQQLLGSDTATADYFGWSVAVDGDTALIGAKYEEELPEENFRGSAYVFSRSGTLWTQTDKLKASDGAAQHEFGYAVALDKGVAVVGAARTPELGEYTGSAYVFAYNGSDWAETRNLAAVEATADAWYGSAVAVDGNTCLVGAYSADAAGADSGEAYFYDSCYTALQSETLVVPAPGVLGNDYDLDGDTIQVSGTYDALHGYVMQTTLGSFEYTPDEGFTGMDSFQYRVYDGMDYSATATVSIFVEGWHEYVPIEGDDRYATAAEAARTAFSDKGADTVVIATGRNFPDALGGSALAGALEAPLLLVETASVPAEVVDVIQDLGITNAVILGGTGAVAPGVETQLLAAMGASSEVTRVAGANRYDTARKVAAKVVDTLGVEYENVAFVATGANFPDALAAGPLAAGQGWPIYLAENGAGDAVTVDAMEAAGVTEVHVLGGTGVVKPAMYSALQSAFGAASVDRLAGDNRYETAAKVVLMGINDVGAHWSGAGLATGANFPDALAAGAALGYLDTVLLLSDSKTLSPATEDVLSDYRAYITEIHYFGGLGALSQAVRDRVAQVVEAP